MEARGFLSYLKITAVWSILILTTYQVLSQDYTCVNENRVLTYSTPLYSGTDDLIFLKAKTVSSVGSDVVISFEKHFREVPDCFECFQECIAGSIFGNEMIKKTNGVNIFFNERGDSIFINTTAELNDSFKLVMLTDTIIQAKLVRIYQDDVLGEQDSSKTFILKATNAQQQTIPHWLNGDSIVLSKNHGLIKAFDFYSFPDYYTYNNYRKPYFLVGQTNPESGMQNLDAFDIYDFEIGDEFHLEGSIPYTVITKIKRIVIDKQVGNGSITYKIDYLRIVNNPVGIIERKDTLELNVSETNMSRFWTLPDGSARSSMSNSNGKLIKHLTNYGNSDSCIGVHAEDCWARSEKYEPGLGLTQIGYVQSWACSEIGPYLVYYKKGSTTWGTPLNFNVGIEAQKTNLPVKIISQPFTNSTKLIFNYQSTQNINIRVFNQLGQLISNEQIQIDKGTHQISDIRQHGIYFINIYNNGKSQSFKILR